MKKAELEEVIKDEVRKIVIAHKEGHLTQEEYVIKMNAYSEVIKAINS